MPCKTWRRLAKYWNPLCGMRFMPDTGNSSCPVCVSPFPAPSTPCSELAFGEGNPWPIVEVAVPDLHFTSAIETWGNGLATPFAPWSSQIWPSYGNDPTIGTMYGRLNQVPWACEGVRTATEFRIFETSPGRWYQVAHQCHLQFVPNPPNTSDSLLIFEVSRTIGRFYPNTTEWPIWGRIAASYKLDRSAVFYPNSNPMPRVTLTASFESYTASLIHGTTLNVASTGRRPGVSGQGLNPAYNNTLPYPFTPPLTVDIKLVGF